MESKTALDLWRWPLAVLLGLATMSLAVIAAGIANRALFAIPHWARPLVLPISAMTIPITAVITAILRRRKLRAGARRTGAGARV